MPPTTLHADIVDLFEAGLGLSVPSAEADLFETGVLDSMSFVELLLQIETAFGLTLNLPDIEFENFRSIDRIADFIAKSGAGKPPV
jgi:methoxymalonate biosynthesis acyl carrier protein